ncbi:MAG: murein biosynthesis integral membrane protein MurJ, partial [Anaerolineales bacterium]
LISGGALAIAFIPVLTERMQAEGRKALWDLFSRVANLAFLITGGLALVLVVAAPSLVRAELGVAPGFTPELQTLVADLMRLNLIATLIFSISGLVSAGLQANQHFLLPAMAPVLYDVGQIFGALVLAPEEPISIAGITLPNAGLGVHGLVYGVILGAFLHLAVQIPGLLRYKFHWTPSLGLDNPAVRKVGRLMAPRILTIGAFNLIFVVQDNLASRLDVGSVTALAYGWLIMQVPETIIGTAVGIAILPTLSEHFSRQDESAFQASIQRAGRTLVALTLPAAVLLWITIRPLIEIAFNFDTYGTDLVVWATRAYLIGLVGHSLLEIAARAWYARQNARFPLMATAVSAVTFVAMGIILFRPLGAAGIGLSNSLAFTLEAGILIVLLMRHYPGLAKQKGFLLRVVSGCLLGGMVSWALLQFLPFGAIFTTLAALTGGGLVILPFIWTEIKNLVRL